MNQHINNLLAALQSYAPNGDAQVKAAELVQNAQRHGANDDEVIEALAGAILDGLRHGNWPWPAQRDTAQEYREWREFQTAMKNMTTTQRLENLRDWYNDRPHTHTTETLPGGTVTSGRDRCTTCNEVNGYLKRLIIAKRIPQGATLIEVLAWDWNIRVLKERI